MKTIYIQFRVRCTAVTVAIAFSTVAACVLKLKDVVRSSSIDPSLTQLGHYAAHEKALAFRASWVMFVFEPIST